ncbi:hypothetical protein [Nocardia neocaledoniensis]|nr:hypothetical protein [Nocardia neocaledoniensis]
MSVKLGPPGRIGPNSAAAAAKTIRPTCAHTIAAEHIGHGSPLA